MDTLNKALWKIRPYVEVIPLALKEFEERKEKSTLLRDAKNIG
ncbi:MAG: hypothetical protein ACTSR0_00080 [Candidatus Asgardarchaeia archaeon]